ncbi:phosphodiester glycosidase family protein [Candidatus Margulisiibacteriota bacterium]
MSNKILLLLLITLITLTPAKTSASEYVWQKSVEKGIDYIHIKRKTLSGSLHIHLLAIDLKNENIEIRPELARGRIGDLEKTSNIALGCNAIAAINGSFFVTEKDSSLPLGNLIIDNKLLSKSILNRTAIGFTKDKKIIFGIPKIKGYVINRRNRKGVEIWGVNRPRKQNETIIYTSEYGGSTKTNQWGKELIVNKNDNVIKKRKFKGSTKIPKDGFVVSLHGWSRDFYDNIKVGDKLELKYKFVDGWQNASHAVTGGPLLIKNGNIVVDKSIKDEKMSSYLLPPNSRTAIGVNKDNKLILAVIDKRYAISKGATYNELAQVLKKFGVRDAMGLDGGGTSTMYISGRVVNYPLNFNERAVSNAIVVRHKNWDLSDAFVEQKLFVSSNSSLTKNAFRKIIKEKSDLTPASYIFRPEDYGLYGIKQLYKQLIKPLINENKYTYRPESFLNAEDLSVFSQGRSRSDLPK